MTGYAIPIVALDVPTAGDAIAIARQLREDCHFFKVGSALYTAAGPTIVREIRERIGADVFLDLKYHDIPTTVAGAVRAATALGVRLLTVHASGGRAMLEAAQEASRGKCGVLGVTVLTSHDDDSLAAALDKLVASGAVVSRSDGVRVALERFIDRCRRDQIGAEIVAGYQAIPQTAEEVGWSDAATIAMIAEEPW